MGWGADLVGGIVDTVRERDGGRVGVARDLPSDTDESFDSAVEAVSAELPDVPRPEGINGADIFSWFHHGAGTGSADAAVAGWDELARYQQDVARAAYSALAELDPARQDARRESAHAGTDFLARTADRASETATRCVAVVQARSEDFDRANKHVVPVPAEPPRLTLSSPVHPLDAGGQAHRSHEFQAQQRANRAVLVEYARRTAANTPEVPFFSEPDPADHDWSGGSASAYGTGEPSSVSTAETSMLGTSYASETLQRSHPDVPGEPVPPRVVATPPGWRDSPPWAEASVSRFGGHQRAEETRHDQPEYLVDADPHEVFGSTEPVGPAALGAPSDEPAAPDPETT
ncbi:hypothetical protein GIY23_03520 [Allosaccharopolyspora coralli]|uniref:PPE domain-containing protein n=1 Tax=Allosaccharopolyspora coralli TaxID=2665642 RepID=A0A5Q3Q6E6_9PSEU|nr:hypothetical protein [Allosaccharopolyspora coralli]QGK68744.1 hypothetical protein GIY23_03520 [Allosaccharopolyspora coralli]